MFMVVQAGSQVGRNVSFYYAGKYLILCVHMFSTHHLRSFSSYGVADYMRFNLLVSRLTTDDFKVVLLETQRFNNGMQNKAESNDDSILIIKLVL